MEYGSINVEGIIILAQLLRIVRDVITLFLSNVLLVFTFATTDNVGPSLLLVAAVQILPVVPAASSKRQIDVPQEAVHHVRHTNPAGEETSVEDRRRGDGGSCAVEGHI